MTWFTLERTVTSSRRRCVPSCPLLARRPGGHHLSSGQLDSLPGFIAALPTSAGHPHPPSLCSSRKAPQPRPVPKPRVACLPFSQAAFGSQLEQDSLWKVFLSLPARTSAAGHTLLTPGALPSPQVPDDDVHWSLCFFRSTSISPIRPESPKGQG